MVDGEVDAAFRELLRGATPRSLESETLEFKSDRSRSRDDTLRLLAEAAACLANARGGVVVHGLADDSVGEKAILGTELEPAVVKRRVFELTDPSLVIDVEPDMLSGKRILLLKVPSSPAVHAVSGRCSERVGAACEPMGPERIAAVVTDRRADDWSAHATDTSPDAVDPVALHVARELMGRAADPSRQSASRLSDIDLLRRLGVITTSGTLTQAGVVLFTNAGQDRLSYTFRRSPTGALVASEHMSGPLLVAVDRVFALIEARLDRTSVNVARGQQLQVADLPEGALREAVVNAVMHRSYHSPGPVVVEHAPTRFSVSSPGSFLTGVTPYNVLTTSSLTRNGHLAGVVRALGLAEEAGTGVDRMYAEMARIGHQPPTFTDDRQRVQVTLRGGAPNAYLTRFTSSLPREESEDADTMVVLLTLLTHRTVTAGQMSSLFQRPVGETGDVLARLAADSVGLLEPTRQTAGRSNPTYRLRGEVVAALGPAVTYHRRSPDEYDRKIIGMVRESGQINARMVRILLDLDTAPASRILGELVEREVLMKTSQAQRGTAVTYGPGPKFPPRSSRARNGSREAT